MRTGWRGPYALLTDTTMYRLNLIWMGVALFAQSEAVVISPDFVVEGRIVKGVPYTAQAVTSAKQTLPTGSEIVTQMTALVARDAEGRTRREQTIRAIGPWAVAPNGEAATVIVIQDPVKGMTYTLNPRSHSGRARRMNAPPLSEDRRMLEETRRRESAERPQKVEDLGMRRIEGILAQGRKTTTTLPARSIGNTGPIEIVAETWYSPELQVVIQGTRRDPRVGDITYRLVNIKRDDPPPSLFEPADYRIEGDGEKRKE